MQKKTHTLIETGLLCITHTLGVGLAAAVATWLTTTAFEKKNITPDEVCVAMPLIVQAEKQDSVTVDLP